MISREARIFLIVGALTVGVDFLTYHLLLSLTGGDTSIAKAVGFLTGTAFAYVVNRAWTFNQHVHASGSLWRFGLLYGTTLMANVAVNALVLRTGEGLPQITLAAFLLATATSAVLNFLGMKHFVFSPTQPKTKA